jgi:hypothetical protein
VVDRDRVMRFETDMESVAQRTRERGGCEVKGDWVCNAVTRNAVASGLPTGS